MKLYICSLISLKREWWKDIDNCSEFQTKAIVQYQGNQVRYFEKYFLQTPADHSSLFLTSVNAGLLDDDLMPCNCSPLRTENEWWQRLYNADWSVADKGKNGKCHFAVNGKNVCLPVK